MDKDEDIENQFCIIDKIDNPIQYNQIELLNFNTYKNNKFKINKFRKSKSYPDKSMSDLDIQNFNSYERKESIIFNKNNNIVKHVTNYALNDNLIENKSTIEISLGSFKKICNYFKYFLFCNLSKINKIEILNKFLTICLHVLIMVIFEIYFYFNYVVFIEKDEFLNQIDKYFGQLNDIPIDSTQKKLIKYIFNSNNSKYNIYLDYLYNQYINSLSSQKKLLQKLLIEACTMASIIGIIFVLLFVSGLFYRKKIKWNWIWIENLLMFVFLGIFEYFFFMTIIMHYNPITDAEIKYYMVDGIIKYFNSTS